MTPSKLKNYLAFAIKNHFPVLIKGKPGIGKSEIVAQAAVDAGAELIITHPVVSDPTDYKGLPYAKEGEAMFLPYSDLKKLIEADKLTLFFIDDMGQAPASVQAALMQLLLAREINGHKISEHVVFIAATNRKEDMAAVTGLLEPVKSRFASIVELNVSYEDWVDWALDQDDIPVELIQFIRFKPDILDNAKPSKDIVNTVSPRTIAQAGRQQYAGLPKDLYFEVFKGAAGEVFATEYTAFLDMFLKLPSIDEIKNSPMKAALPDTPGAFFAMTALIPSGATRDTMDPVVQYVERLPLEVQAAIMRNIDYRRKELLNTKAYIKWATKNKATND